MIVQFGPDGVSFFYLAQDLYLYVWNRGEEETPVFPYTCLPNEVSFRLERLLAAIVRRATSSRGVSWMPKVRVVSVISSGES
jgi:hypothetical protein